ncbi:MAG: hydantoinase B/oxoprolinase family protein [Gammaproteobacteria bacterium]
MNSIELSLFQNRIQAVCDEMGAVLRGSAFSPNIKDRLDFSCAVFDAAGALCAQAAHIPVHLGSMAYAMADIVERFDWRDGDMIILNDPYLGGTHLPDITLVAPVFADTDKPLAFVANRAHHADIGAATPGSMPVATHLSEEGLIIPPTLIMRRHKPVTGTLESILAELNNRTAGYADLSAQMSANHSGRRRMATLIRTMGRHDFITALEEVNDYAERLARTGIGHLPAGRYSFTDVMDDDGTGKEDIAIKATLIIDDNGILIDFDGTAPQVSGNINCPLSVTAAAVYYCFYCLMPPETPACAGSFRPLTLKAPAGSVLNAASPAAVAAGNVETSSRIVDVILGALSRAVPDRVPAASQGSMNNIAMGGSGWDYYETIGGGSGAGPRCNGLDGIQTHMTNTLNTPIEVVEMHYPLRITRYALRQGSGGAGRHSGGEGLCREYEFTSAASVTLLTERRRHSPWGLAGGNNGLSGRNSINGTPLPGKTQRNVGIGDRLLIETPGGGGWGKPTST